MSEKDDDKKPEPKEVRVTVHYTMTAREKSFEAKVDETVRQVIEEAYKKLEERQRPGDQYFCHIEPRIDLSPYLDRTVRVLMSQKTCVHEQPHGNKLVFGFDIDADTGGAGK
ncbi:MAG TPA: hypothetical protein VGN10_13135 [Pyrinomonadaceae bacterium]|jgi:hypothetical protein